MGKANKWDFSILLRHADVIFSLVLMGIIGLLIFPIPSPLMDVLLALSLGSAILVLMIVVYIKNPPEFSVFPTILLSVTLFRLGLNIATTRLILLDGFAGRIIESFGSFVVRGNYVVGTVVFLILVIINFVVITKGAGRIAEVSARFTLDAMPGKQMAIDAELNSGLIDEATAKSRREAITNEADFYGSMDGASKFVRGDAIAGILITLVNIIGGISIGVFQKNLALVDSLQKYTLLSIGDGLVSQIPALVISVGTGILITRSAGDSNLGDFIGKQITAYPRAICLAGGIMLVFGFLPGLPFFPFVLVGGVVLFAGIRIQRAEDDQIIEIQASEDRDAENQKALTSGNSPSESIQVLKDEIESDLIGIELGLGLVRFADPQKDGDLLDRITSVRKSIAQDMGLLLPPVAVRDNLEIDNNAYQILIRGRVISRGGLRPDRWLAIGTDNTSPPVKGIPTIEPAFGLEAVWINDEEKSKAEIGGYTVVDPLSVLVTHVTEMLKTNAHRILEREDVQRLIDIVKERNPTLVSELFPDKVSVGLVQRVLQNLLSERVPIRNFTLILETLSDYADVTKNPDELSEQVRRRLGAYFVPLFESEPGKIFAITLDPKLEHSLIGRVKRSQFEVGLMMDPGLTEHILNVLGAKLEELQERGISPILITTTELRLPFKRFFDPSFPRLQILAYQELPNEIEVESIGYVPVPLSEQGGTPPAPTNLPVPATANA